MHVVKVLRTLALCVGVAAVGSSAKAAIIQTVPTVQPGVWTSDLEGAKAASAKDNVPLLLFWGNTGCSHCEGLEKELNGSTFKEWMASNQIYMVFKEADKTSKAWIQSVAKANGRKISSYPFALVYWPTNTYGSEVLQAFSAYKGNMGEFGAKSKQTNLAQFMTALNYLLADWDPAANAHTHQWSAWTVTKAATCTAAGERTRTCSAADCPSPTETEVIPATGHSWSAWSTVTEAAIGVKGLKERHCTHAGCTAKETADIPALEPEEEEVDLSTVYNKIKKFEAIAYYGDELFGKVNVTISKYNARKNYVKLTVKISAFTGKTYSKAVNVAPNKYGDLEDVLMKFKNPVGEMTVNVAYDDGEFAITGEGEDYSIGQGEVTIGGYLEAEEMSLSIEWDDDIEPERDDYSFIIEAPYGATATVRNGKTFNFGAAPKIKYVKYKEDGEIWYELQEYDEEKYPNENAIKLTYKPTTGAFSGTFYVYASNADSIDSDNKPKLKSYKGSFSGVIVNGTGVGSASIKIGKRVYAGSCSID